MYAATDLTSNSTMAFFMLSTSKIILISSCTGLASLDLVPAVAVNFFTASSSCWKTGRKRKTFAENLQTEPEKPIGTSPSRGPVPVRSRSPGDRTYWDIWWSWRRSRDFQSSLCRHSGSCPWQSSCHWTCPACCFRWWCPLCPMTWTPSTCVWDKVLIRRTSEAELQRKLCWMSW